MSDTVSVSGLRQVPRPPAPSALSNALVFGWRAVLKFKHVPEQLFDLVMTPIMFTLLFTFVFGGALAGSPREYLQFFLPGILVQTVVFNSVYSGMGLSTDLGKGLFDRFRSLPIWSLAPFAGLMVGELGFTRESVIVLGTGCAILLALPVISVVSALIEEMRRRDWPFVAAALLVLVLLAYSVLEKIG